MIEVSGVHKWFGEPENRSHILKGISVRIRQGEICTVLGHSGSGKSTLLNVIGGLEQPDQGSVAVDQTVITNLSPLMLQRFRRANLGFIFQMYHLIPDLTVRENIALCEYLSDAHFHTEDMLNLLELKDHADKFPSQLSGGQQQRCAIGRAIVKNPKLLLCDEPTGALDVNSGIFTLRLLEQINRDFGTTIVMVTHNNTIQEMAHHIIRIRDGEILEDSRNEHPLAVDQIAW
ncbi:MAG TPA: ABC transporter ATP-binding protein [Ruminococcus sp.]|nr:ABC transporter ATP-binding protein [Ruminococcus sp.]